MMWININDLIFTINFYTLSPRVIGQKEYFYGTIASFLQDFVPCSFSTF